MSTKVSYQTWSGGSGIGDHAYLIGYCKETPQEVLKYIYKNYNIYHYKNLYRPIDDNYPNNVEGLDIQDATNELEKNFKGCTIIINNSISDLDISKAITKSHRNKDTVKKSFEKCKAFHLGFLTNEEWIKKYNEELKEVEEIIIC